MRIEVSRVLLILILASVAWYGGISEAAAQSVTPVALAASVSGDATFCKAGSNKWKRLYVLSELGAGDKIRIGSKSNARIYFYKDTHSEILNSPCTIAITADSCKLEKGEAACVKKVPPYKGIDSSQSIKVSNEQFGGFITKQVTVGVDILQPLGAIADKQPSFQWKAVSGATAYKVSLLNEDGDEMWGQTTKDTNLPYPASNESLSFGQRYQVKVNALSDKTVIGKGECRFSIVTLEISEKLKDLKAEVNREIQQAPKDTAPYAVLLAFYMQNGLLEDALKMCSTLCQMDPENADVHYWMSQIYKLRGMEEKSKEELKKAGER